MKNLQLDFFIEDDSQKENHEDINEISFDIFSNAVVSGNDWTTETIINQINKGNIQLNPSFQRRDAWDKERKSKFIESLILGLPIPQIVLAESREGRGKYIVLDGKQRLLSIRQFAADADDNTYRQLKLTDLDVRKSLKGYSLSTLKEDHTLYDDLASFENQPIRTVVIKNWPNEDFLFHVFLRLNTGSVPLSPQELRQALHPGEFINFIDIQSANSQALQEILKNKEPDFRMRDAELLLRYFSFKNFLSEYTGTLKVFLDDTCHKLNENWENEQDKIQDQLNQFEEAHKFIKQIFGNKFYRKWSKNSYENRFNRSVFDAMILSFSNSEVRKLSQNKEYLIETAYQELCDESKSFISSIESTTKSITATAHRISLWNDKLNKVIGSNLPTPEVINNRIV